MKLSIIIPAYNEGRRIEKTLEDYVSYKWKYPVEILVILNGCKDNTLDVVSKFAKKHRIVKYINLAKASKGYALITGFKLATGDLIGYVDADNATKPKEFSKLIDNINGYDGVIGSRWVKGAVVRVKQSLARRIASRGFNLLVRTVLGLRFYDTQCGVKIYRKNAIKSILPKLKITNWAIDVSVLYPLVKAGYKIREVPTVWQDKKGSRLKLFKAIPNMFWAVIKLRLKS